MPGHSTAWFVGYPKSPAAGPYSLRPNGAYSIRHGSTSEDLSVSRRTDRRNGQVFPDHYFHISGDEVNGKEWDANRKFRGVQEIPQSKTNDELQATSASACKIVTGLAKPSSAGTSLYPRRAKGHRHSVLRGQQSLAAAARQSYRGILSNGYYLDLGWSAARTTPSIR
jgi:hexosaminidase